MECANTHEYKTVVNQSERDAILISNPVVCHLNDLKCVRCCAILAHAIRRLLRNIRLSLSFTTDPNDVTWLAKQLAKQLAKHVMQPKVDHKFVIDGLKMR